MSFNESVFCKSCFQVIANSDYNEQIRLVPSMFAINEFHCIKFDSVIFKKIFFSGRQQIGLGRATIGERRGSATVRPGEGHDVHRDVGSQNVQHQRSFPRTSQTKS